MLQPDGTPEIGERVYWDLVERLVAAGLAAETANVGVDTLFGYVNGFTIEEQAAQRGCDDARFRAGIELLLDGIRLRLPCGARGPRDGTAGPGPADTAGKTRGTSR